jgi:hypothetical protein
LGKHLGVSQKVEFPTDSVRRLHRQKFRHAARTLILVEKKGGCSAVLVGLVLVVKVSRAS